MHRYWIIFITLIILLINTGFTQTYPDSLLQLIPEAHDSVKIKLYNNLYVYYQEKNSDKALSYLNKSLQIADKNKYGIKKGDILSFIGHIYERRGSYDKAIKKYNEALQIFDSINFEKGKAVSYSNLSAAYVDKGEYAKALETGYASLKYFEKDSNLRQMATNYNNIGLIYYFQNDYDKALENYNISLELRKRANDKEGLALCYNNLGIVYYYKNELEKVLESFFNSLEIYEELNNLRGQVLPLFNIGEIYKEQSRFDDAIEYYFKSLKIDKQLGDIASIAGTYVSIGDVYIEKKLYTTALKYHQLALKYINKTDSKLGKINVYMALSETYNRIGNYKNAYEMMQKYSVLNDSIYNEEKAKAIANIQTKYETERKEEEIAILNKEKKLDELKLKQKQIKIKRQQFQLIITGVILVLILIFTYMLLKLLKRNKHKTYLLSEKNHEINQQKEELQTALNLINEQKEQLLKTNEDLVETTKVKEVFLANTTHEIRTPVNIISGFTNLLLGTSINTIQKRYLKNIKNSADNLLAVINDILTFSKIEAGKLTIESIDFNLREGIENYFDSVRITAGNKKLNITYKIDPGIPEFIIGDPVRLQQIISNLVGNAIKFTANGGFVKTLIEKTKENDKEIVIKFTIQDNGIGIEKDKLEKIFESFTQADKSTSRKYGGTGLGLSIVKKLVQLQGGEIKVESIINEGSTFTFILPYKKRAKQIKSTEKETPLLDKKITKNINVLVADDNPVNAELIIDMFQEYDPSITVDVVDNGQTAINKLKRIYYHILLLDIQMPIMDGFKTTEYIRKNLSGPAAKIPIIALSAFADDVQRDKCLQSGMNAYLSKPFEPRQLFNKISNILGIDSQHEKVLKSKDKNKKIVQDLKFINLSFLNKTYNFKTDKVLKILTLCLQEIPKQIDQLSNDNKKSNTDKVRIAAHSLKTSLNYLGLKNLKEKASFIEKNSLSNNNKNEIAKNILFISKSWPDIAEEIKEIINKLH
ncbi:MAG: tetratricopeptide repeat protein [Chlorobi bacterium]|nr:tetratricopeptide repeat protein [Chlorobiota bacterium]